MPRYAPNKASLEAKRRFFELIRQGMSGQAASLTVGVSPSCGSLWFIDADRVSLSSSRSAAATSPRTTGSRSPRAWRPASR